MADKEVLLQVAAYADGELNAAARAAIEQQVKEQPELRRELERLKKLDQAAAASPTPVLNADHSARVWQNIAAQTVSPPAEYLPDVQLSARHDGETTATASAPSETAESARMRRIWARLDAAAASLPVPALPETAARELFATIAQRTVAVRPEDRRAWTLLEKTAAETAPQLPAAAFEKARVAVAEHVADRAGVPAVSPARWNDVWQGIQARIEKPTAAPTAPVPARNVVAVDFRRAQRRPWRWIIAAGIAAALALVVIYPPMHTPEEPSVVEIPEPPDDDSYQVYVKYVAGQKEPIVCYFKNEPQAAKPKPKADWRWLPD